MIDHFLLVVMDVHICADDNDDSDDKDVDDDE